MPIGHVGLTWICQLSRLIIDGGQEISKVEKEGMIVWIVVPFEKSIYLSQAVKGCNE
jgi:hypothetical protein